MNRNKLIESAQTRVMFVTPFFGAGVMRCAVEFGPTQHGTACTDGKRVVFDPDWFDGLAPECRTTILVHEAWHNLAEHAYRAPAEAKVDGESWDLWNQACDHETNLMLKEFSKLRMDKGLADPFPFPEPSNAYCADPRFEGQAAEVIFRTLLADRAKKPPGGSHGKPVAGGGSKPQAGGQGSGKPGPHSIPAFGQFARPDPSHDNVKEREEWKRIMVTSAALAKGSLPAGLDRLVRDIVSPSIPWRQILMPLLREQVSDDWDFLCPAMEYSSSGFILPSLRSDRAGSVVFVKDTSGSIEDEILSEFTAAEQDCLDSLKPKRLTDICCDAAVHSVKEYAPGDTVEKLAAGGGGTDFRPAFAEATKREDCRAVVYLTDLQGTFPETDPGIPTFWIVIGSERPVPFGTVVPIKPEGTP